MIGQNSIKQNLGVDVTISAPMAEALGGDSQASYNASLDSIANAIMADLGVPLIPCKLQQCYDRDVTNVNAAIGEAWANNPNVKAGPDLSDLTPVTANDVHFRTDAEMITVGGRWATAIRAAFGW